MAIRLPDVLKDFSLGEVSKAVFSRMGGEVHSAPMQGTPNNALRMKVLTLADIEQFAAVCRRSYPSVMRCSVYCQMMETSATFQITQIMLDKDNKAVRLPNDHEIAGRIVYAETLDIRLHAMTKGVFPCEFCFPLA